MGEVWLVQHRKTRLPYAAKTLRLELARNKDEVRFRREVEILMGLDHLNVAKLYDATKPGESPFGYLMEYCPDGDITKQEKLNIVLTIKELVAAIVYLHEHGFIHRDIKPTNILIGIDGHIRLADFGLAVTADPGRPTVTTSNWKSEGFSPPEQYINMATVDERGDIYSVGAVWYYLLRGTTYDFNREAHVQLEGVNERFRWVLGKCLKFDRVDRLSSAKELQQVIADVQRSDILGTYLLMDPEPKALFIEEQFGIWKNWEDIGFEWYELINDLSEAIEHIKYLVKYESNRELLARLNGLSMEMVKLNKEWENFDIDPL